MITLAFLLCIRMHYLEDNSCYVHELYSPKEYLIENKQAIMDYARNNFMTVAMFTVRF